MRQLPFHRWPSRSCTPSAARPSATALDTSGSSRTSRRGAISTCVTAQPSRAKAWLSSQPIGPPPSTSRRSGRVRSCQMVSDVSASTSSMPGMGGTNGRAPAAMTMARVVSVCTWPPGAVISTCQGETMRARPSATSTPKPV